MSDWTQGLVILGLMLWLALTIMSAEYMDREKLLRGGLRASAAFLGIAIVIFAIKEL